jgi:hypothetical protein
MLLVSTWAFSDYVDETRPNHPTGHFTIQTENHGQDVYISHSDKILRTSGWVAFVTMFLLCIVLEAWDATDSD